MSPASENSKPSSKPNTNSKQANLSSVRVAIVTDWLGGGGQTGEQEAENIKKRVIRALRPRVPNFVYVGDKMSSLLTADLLVFDYGGMASAYRKEGVLSAYDYGRIVCQWMVDHPSSLVVIASTFSYQVLIEHELHELGFYARRSTLVDDPNEPDNRPPNLVVGYMAFPVYNDERKILTEMEQSIHDWFFQ